MILRSIIILLCLSFSSLSSFAKPNILLIIADDMGLETSRCYNVGSQQAKMPYLEQLCASGRVYEKFYVAPVCSPTRATLMTGKYGFRTGVGSAVSPDNPNGLSDKEVSLFDILNDAGYASNIIGKWHLASPDEGLDHPKRLGVSDFYGLYSGGTKSYTQMRIVENERRKQVTGYATSVFTDKAISWVNNQQKPWFLWLAFNAPHTPFHAPPENLHSYGKLSTEKRDMRRNRITYYNAALQALDTEIGRLLRSMSQETRENTILMFMGDNGSPNQIAKDVYGARGAKGGIYEGGTHVPLIVAGKGITKGRSADLINSTDLYATIANIAGAKSQAIDSISFNATFHGGKNERKFVYVEHFANSAPKGKGSHGWAIRDSRYKLVAQKGKAKALFDLENDPFETKNLLQQDVKEAKAVALKLEKFKENLK